jgi:hypothetical protein
MESVATSFLNLSGADLLGGELRICVPVFAGTLQNFKKGKIFLPPFIKGGLGGLRAWSFLSF